MGDFLSGKKTHIIVIVTIIGIAARVYTDDIDIQTALQLGIAALGMSTLRTGMNK